MNLYDCIKSNMSRVDFELTAHVSLKNNYFTMCSSKCASGTIKYYLQSKEFQGSCLSIQNVDNRYMSPILSPFQLGEEKLKSFFEGNPCKFTFVRNPLDRVFSVFKYKVQVDKPAPCAKPFLRSVRKSPNEVTFLDFLLFIKSQKISEMNKHYRPLYNDQLHAFIDYDFVGRVESLQHDMLALARRIFGDDYEIPGVFNNIGEPLLVRNENGKLSPHEPLSNIYEGETEIFESSGVEKSVLSNLDLEVVTEVYKCDFETFGYSL